MAVNVERRHIPHSVYLSMTPLAFPFTGARETAQMVRSSPSTARSSISVRPHYYGEIQFDLTVFYQTPTEGKALCAHKKL